MSNTQKVLGHAGSEHKLVGCHNRLSHQIARLSDFVEKITGVLSPDDEEVGQFATQMIAIAIHSFAEEYFSCLFSVGTVHREQAVREFLRQEGTEAEVGVLDAGCSLGTLTGMMKRRIRFGRNRARALRRTFEFLFRFEAFPDERTADLLIDLAKVRHLIVHAGAWPGEAHAHDISEEGVIVQTGEIDWDNDPAVERGGKTRFYKLDLRNRFLLDAMVALRNTAVYHHGRLKEDPQWKL